MPSHRITRTTITALLVALTAALIARAMIRIHLVEQGYATRFASDLAYMVVPVVLALLLFPLWRTEKAYILAQFPRADFNWRLIVRAISVGVLLRLAWWSQLVAGISFGLYRGSELSEVVPLTLSFECPPALVLGSGLVIMAMLVPLIEEVVHRGYMQGILLRRGFVLSVLISAIVFTVFHSYTTWTFVFVAGCVFAAQYWYARSLWPSVIAHATYNGLIQLDWRCIAGRWNPATDDPKLIVPGIIATLCLAGCAIAICKLIPSPATGARNAPR
jgi:membrane protease YdiL (CAAX protease family)